MTLVVARTSDRILRIISDTLSNDPDSTRRLPFKPKTPRPPFNGTLKAATLNHSQCVCFAGVVDFGHRAIKALFEKKLHFAGNDDLVLQHLLEAHESSNRATDFLLGSLVGESASISVIRSGRVERNLSAAWIGNSLAFEHYQRLFHAAANEGSAASSSDPIRRMANAFTQLMFEQPTDEQGDLLVGDFMIAVETVPEGLTYGTGLGMFPAKEVYTSTEWEPVSVGDVADGGYTYSVLAPFVAGLPLVAVYIATAGVGLVFSPFLEGANPQEISAATPEEFIAAVERDFGFRPRGWVFEGKAARRVG